MRIFYLLTINCNRELEDGMLKNVNDLYILDAVSYTDAETVAYAFAEETVSGDFNIPKITKTNIAEIIKHEDSDLWFKCKVVYATVDGEREVKVNTYLLVSASDARQAYDRVEEHLKTMLVPFSIPTITETKIVEVINGEEYSK